MLDHYSYFLKALKAAAEGTMRAQCTDADSRMYGSIEALNVGVDNAHTGIGVASQLALAYFWPGSAYERNRECLNRATAAMKYALRLQHEDGTLDLLTTNFHDASETAFCVEAIAPVYLFLRERLADDTDEKRLAGLIYTFVDRAADVIMCGGFHTPNHRWVQSAALALCHKVTGRGECLERMRRFLAEGMDCDENGEYTERSAGVYNIICNKALINIARYAEMPELLEHVKRNLGMVRHYTEPDFTVNTMNSTRQDMGTGPDWKIYYPDYLYMALVTGDAAFAGIADLMLEQLQGAGGVTVFDFITHFDAASLKSAQKKVISAVPAFDGEHFFENSGIVRIRKGECTLTLLRNNPAFAKLQCGRHTAYLRAGASFYSRAQFRAQTIEKTESGYRLSFRDRWGYKQPFAEPPPTSVWSEMDHSRRENVMMQDFVWTMDITPRDDGITLVTSAGGTDRVPAKLEIMLDPDALYENESVIFRPAAGTCLCQRSDTSVYRYADHTSLMLKGGFAGHYSAADMRGTLPAAPDRFTLTFTDFTPFSRKVTLIWKTRN